MHGHGQKHIIALPPSPVAGHNYKKRFVLFLMGGTRVAWRGRYSASIPPTPPPQFSLRKSSTWLHSCMSHCLCSLHFILFFYPVLFSSSCVLALLLHIWIPDVVAPPLPTLQPFTVQCRVQVHKSWPFLWSNKVFCSYLCSCLCLVFLPFYDPF